MNDISFSSFFSLLCFYILFSFFFLSLFDKVMVSGDTENVKITSIDMRNITFRMGYTTTTPNTKLCTTKKRMRPIKLI